MIFGLYDGEPIEHAVMRYFPTVPPTLPRFLLRRLRDRDLLLDHTTARAELWETVMLYMHTIGDFMPGLPAPVAFPDGLVLAKDPFAGYTGHTPHR